MPVISIMRHKAAQGRGTLSPNQLHMYSVCLIQPLPSGAEQSLKPWEGDQEQPGHPLLPAGALTPQPPEATTSSLALGMGEPPALARE